MSKKNKGNFRKVSEKIFMSMTRKKAKERINSEFNRYIKKEEKQAGEKLSEEEIKSLRKDFVNTRGKEIRREEARKARVKATAIAFAATLGVSGYALGTNNIKIPGITDGKEAIEVNMDEVNKDVEIENVLQEEKEDENKHAVFVKELQDAAINENVEEINILEKDVKQEINNLKTPQEVKDYIKEMYLEEYNKENAEKIGKENLELYKSTADIVFYEDKAQNGDEILRYCSENDAREMGIPIDGDYAKISATVTKESGVENDCIAYHNGKFVPVYSQYEEVLEDQETILAELGDVIFQGINMMSYVNKENLSIKEEEHKEEYKNKFIQAIVDFKKSKGELSTENNKTQESQSNQVEFEIGDE